MTARPVLPSTEYRASALQMSYFSALHSSARTHRCRRFACTLTGADARLAEKRGLVAPSLRGTFTLCHMPVSLALVLEDPEAAASERLLAAELAGEIVAMSDELADTLLTILDDVSAAAKLRAQAATSLGPVLEQMDWDSDGQPISEFTFHRIQERLLACYRRADVPKLKLGAAPRPGGLGRAPRDWHADAIRAAYADPDRKRRLTAVMGRARAVRQVIVQGPGDYSTFE